MKKIIDWIKRNPMIAALVIGAVILVVILFSRGSSGGGGQVVVAGSNDGVGSGTELQLAQMQMQAQVYGINAQLQDAESQRAADIAIASLQANTARFGIEAQTNVQRAGIQAQTAVSIAGLQTQEVLAAYQAATDVSAIHAQVDIAGMQNATMVKLAEFQTATAITQFNTQRDVQLGLADIAAAVDVKQAEYAYLASKAQSSAQKSSGIWGAIAGIAGVAAAFI